MIQENRKLQRDVVRNPENAVYIKGFEEGTKDMVIKDFFQKYGNVVGVLSRFSGHYNAPSQKVGVEILLPLVSGWLIIGYSV